MLIFEHEDGRTQSAEEGSALYEALRDHDDWRQVDAADPEPDEPSAEDGGVPEELRGLKREQLNDVAREAGVEDPEKLPNIAAVIEAIRARQQGD